MYVDAYSVYCTLAEILYPEEDLLFVSLMVQVLNLILFTAAELYNLRMQLKELNTPVRMQQTAVLINCEMPAT